MSNCDHSFTDWRKTGPTTGQFAFIQAIQAANILSGRCDTRSDVVSEIRGVTVSVGQQFDTTRIMIGVVSEPGRKALLQSRFKKLRDKWQTETAFVSSTTSSVMNQAYQSIIGMGADALPLIFAELKGEQDNPHDWFWALTAILGYDPIPDSFVGNRADLAKVWLRWGEQHGFLH